VLDGPRSASARLLDPDRKPCRDPHQRKLFPLQLALGQAVRTLKVKDWCTMRLEQTHYDNRETGCCARLDVARWDGRELTLDKQPFVKEHIHAFLHVPLNMGSVMGREHAAVHKAGAYPEDPYWLVEEVSPWGSEAYMATDRDVPGATMAYLSGRFLTKVFEGPYREIGTWIKAMERYVAERGASVKKLYFYYATCPKCAKQLGKNQVVLFAQVT
jgi:hypothetical protein